MQGDTVQTTLTSKGRMTLPSAVRAQLGLVAGDQLLVSVLDGNTIVLKRPALAPNPSLRGLLKPPPKALTLAEMDAGVSALLKTKYAARKRP
jgi:antitoxin PrlF